MKIFTQILYSALRDSDKFQQNLVARSWAIIFQSWVKIHRLLWQRVDLYSVFIHKIIRTTGIILKNGYIVKFGFVTLYVQFRNDSVSWRKVLLSESVEVTKSDVCIQEIRQRWWRRSRARDLNAQRSRFPHF